jgi:hypothetical protein
MLTVKRMEKIPKANGFLHQEGSCRQYRGHPVTSGKGYYGPGVDAEAFVMDELETLA